MSLFYVQIVKRISDLKRRCDQPQYTIPPQGKRTVQAMESNDLEKYELMFHCQKLPVEAWEHVGHHKTPMHFY